MKYIKEFYIAEGKQELSEEQRQFLDDYCNGNWDLNKETGLVDISYDYPHSFDCTGKGLRDLKGIKFGKVEGSFLINKNYLKSLEGCPEIINGGNFYCSDNLLSSLEGSPKIVNGNFWCDGNNLTSLKGATKEVKAFECEKNHLLKTLEGAPEKASSFKCDGFETYDWTLEGKIKILEGGNPVSISLISTIISPEIIQEEINKNPIEMAIKLKSSWKFLKSNPKYKNINFPKNYSDSIDLLSDLDDIGL